MMIYCAYCIRAYLLIALNNVYSDRCHVIARAAEYDENSLYFMVEAPVRPRLTLAPATHSLT
jgi:hypothetical protein